MQLVLPNWVLLLLAGFLGQVLRVLLGLKKAITEGKKIDPDRIVASLLYAGFWGAVIGFQTADWRLAFTTSFTATDVTESLINVMQKRALKKEE